MKCPFCGKADTNVLESRIVEDGVSIRRRRECEKCKKRFTTFEKVKTSVIWIIKKDGRREPFDREKLKRGILRAVEKRPIPVNRVEEVIEEIQRALLRNKSEEIDSEIVGKEVLKKLKKIDKVAWLRFASVYLEFNDLEDFEKLIKK